MEFYTDFFWLIAILVCIGGLIFSHFYEKKRSQALTLVAKRLGLSFSLAGRQTTHSRHEHLPLFNRGRSGKIKNEMWGDTSQYSVAIFGYQYTQSNGKNSTTYRQTVLSITSTQLNLPSFVLKPENALHKIGQIFGYQDIDFEKFPEFSKRFLLRGDDEERIRSVFTSSLIRYLEKNPNLCLEAKNQTLIIYQDGQRCKTHEIKDFYQDGQTLMHYLVSH